MTTNPPFALVDDKSDLFKGNTALKENNDKFGTKF